MLYSWRELESRQRAFYELDRAADRPWEMREAGSERGETSVFVTLVRSDDELVYSSLRAHWFPDPGRPSDLGANPTVTCGFPDELMEVRLERPMPGALYIVRATYPFSLGPVDIDRLRPRCTSPEAASTLREQSRDLSSDLSRQMAFLRKQDQDLWPSERHPSGPVARPSRPGAPVHPVAGERAAQAVERTIECLGGTLPAPVDRPLALVGICEDVDACVARLLESMAGQVEAARPLLGETADDLAAAAALWALAGPAFVGRAREPESTGASVPVGRRVVDRAAELFRDYAGALAPSLSPDLEERAVARKIVGDDVSDWLERLLAQASLDGLPDAAIVRARLDSSEVSERLAGVGDIGVRLMRLRETKHALARMLEELANSDPDPLVRRHADFVYRLLRRF